MANQSFIKEFIKKKILKIFYRTSGPGKLKLVWKHHPGVVLILIVKIITPWDRAGPQEIIQVLH
jgi:hypothetical protein